jgi:hypothetical protein
MTNEKMNDALAPELDEELAVDYSQEAIDEMRASIADLEEKENALNEKLVKAREAGLIEQSARCRALLQRVVALKQRKKDELRVAEARYLADEIDGFAEDMENELDPGAEVDEEVVEVYNHRAKAKRMRLIAKILRGITLFAGTVGALAYLLLCQPEVMDISFNWITLGIDAAAMAVLFIVAGCIAGSAKTHESIADEIEAEYLVEQELLAEQEREELLSLETLEAAAEAYAIETAGPKVQKTPRKIGPVTVPEIPEKVKKNVHKIVPVAAAATVAVAAACVASSKKKKAEAKRTAAIRRDFFNWLS